MFFFQFLFHDYLLLKQKIKDGENSSSLFNQTLASLIPPTSEANEIKILITNEMSFFNFLWNLRSEFHKVFIEQSEINFLKTIIFC